MKKNKLFLSIISVLGLGLLSVAVISCKKTFPNNSMSIKDIYSQNIVASIGLLDSQLETSKVNVSTQKEVSQKMLLTNTTEIDFNELVSFVKSMATFVDDMENKFVVEESDKDAYETKITYNGQGLDKEEQTYMIYYKETIVNDNDKDKDKDEVETTLEGIAIVDGQEYQVFGKKEVEQDELEIELEIIFDKDNYVKISQEKENNETEYEYEIVKNGKTVNEFEMEFKEKNGKITVEIEKEINGKKEKIEVKGSDNRNTIKIEIELNEIKSKFLCEYFTKEDGSNSYVFTNIENGEKIEVLDKN
jgi:hypothetical protein